MLGKRVRMRYQEEDAVGESRTWAGASRVMEMQATPKREHARAIFSVPLTLRHSANEGFGAVRGISLDISQGGLGAMVQGNLQIGEAVQIDFALGKRKLSFTRAVPVSRFRKSSLQKIARLREELRPPGIRVIARLPGAADAPIW